MACNYGCCARDVRSDLQARVEPHAKVQPVSFLRGSADDAERDARHLTGLPGDPCNEDQQEYPAYEAAADQPPAEGPEPLLPSQVVETLLPTRQG